MAGILVYLAAKALGASASEFLHTLRGPIEATAAMALAALGAPGPNIGVIGGADVFALFLDRYDVFYLTRAPGVWLPGGRPVFPDVPARAPEDVLAGVSTRICPPE